ncbi:MAG: CHAT domain-containing tetratricopeptide repeat protein [Cytophagales bacterium]|nr:CHAT domain-containing tetratricopeptide repeat protein [Cytophagales bacterium]
MKNTILILLLSVSNICLSQNLQSELDSAKYHIERKNIRGALPWLEKARNTIKQSTPVDSNIYLTIHFQLALAFAQTGNAENAEPVFKEAMDILARKPATKNQYAQLGLNFGVFYFNQKKYKEAEPILKKALETRKQLSGEKNNEYLLILGNLASVHYNLKKYNEAETELLKLIAIRRDSIQRPNPANDQELANSLNKLANIYKSQKKYNQAINLSVEALSIIRVIKGENSKEFASGCTALAMQYKAANKYANAEIYALTASNIYNNTSAESLESANAMLLIAGILKQQGKYESSEPMYVKASSAIKKLRGENSIEYANSLNDIALFYTEVGKYEQAEAYYKTCIEISQKTIGDKHPETATTYNNLGLLYKSMGRYEQAEPILKKAQKYRKDILGDKHPDYASSLNNLASLYEAMGRPEQAEPLYKQSLEIIKNNYGTNSAEYASVLTNAAGNSEDLKKYKQAQEYINQSIEIFKTLYGEKHPDYLAALNNLATIQVNSGKFQDAEKIYFQNIQTTKEVMGEKHPNYALSLFNYGILLQEQARYSDAASYLIQALNINKSIIGENHPVYINNLYELAKSYTAMKNYTSADTYWDLALSKYLFAIETYFPSMSEKEKAKFYNVVNPKFEQYNSYGLLRIKDKPEILSKMYDYQLATKALLLNSSNKIKQRILNSNNPQLIAQYRTWVAQNEILAKLYTQTKDEVGAQKINIDSLNNANEELEKYLSSTSEAFRNQGDATPSWTDIQKKLKPDEAACEIIRFVRYRFDSAGIYQLNYVNYIGLVINPSSKYPEPVLMENGYDLENKYIKYYRNAIKLKEKDEFSYNQFWARLGSKLQGAKLLYLSPDGVYNTINLNSVKNYLTGKYVEDEIDIHLVTNTKDLLQAMRENSDKRITLVGNPDFTLYSKNVVKNYPGFPSDQAQYLERATSGILSPLPGTKVEVEKIAGMISNASWNTDLYTEGNALEENVKKINSPKVLHIATHGFFEQDASDKKKKKSKKKSDDEGDTYAEDNPLLRSGLMLAGASLTLLRKKGDQPSLELKLKSQEDGILTAAEAMNINLENTDLVVLSACETGLGEVKNGEGVYGLQRAFNVAGSKSIITSLWTVNDEATQKLMSSFYQEWIKTGNKRLAFRTAQLSLRAQFPDPYYWGAFVMIGE